MVRTHGGRRPLERAAFYKGDQEKSFKKREALLHRIRQLMRVT